MEKKITIVNGVNVDRLGRTIEAVRQDPRLAEFHFSITNRWIDGGLNQSGIGDFYGLGGVQKREQAFILQTDEPDILFGLDHAPNPAEYVLHALAGCLTTSMVYHAAAKGYDIDAVQCKLDGELDLRGFLGVSSFVRKGFKKVNVTFSIEGKLSEAQKAEILSFTGFSPVLDIITHAVPVTIQLVVNKAVRAN